MTLDATPLLDVIHARGGIYQILGIQQPGDVYGPAVNRPREGATCQDRDVRRWTKAYHRMRKTGRVTPWQADRICVHVLGTLPELVWGGAFFDGCDDREVAA